MPCTLEVRVTPKSSRNHLALDEAGRWKVYVTAPPSDGQANAAVCALIAKALDVPKTSVRVVGGWTWRTKTLEIAALEIGEALERLTRSCRE